MNDKFARIAAAKEAESKKSIVKDALGEIKHEIENCMEAEMDESSDWPVDLVDKLAALHSQLEEIGVKRAW